MSNKSNRIYMLFNIRNVLHLQLRISPHLNIVSYSKSHANESFGEHIMR